MLGLLLAIVTGTGAARNLWLSFTGTTAEGVVVRQMEELSVDWRDELPGPLGSSQTGIHTAPAQRVYRAVVDFQAGGTSYEVIANTRSTGTPLPAGFESGRGVPARQAGTCQAPA